MVFRCSIPAWHWVSSRIRHVEFGIEMANAILAAVSRRCCNKGANKFWTTVIPQTFPDSWLTSETLPKYRGNIFPYFPYISPIPRIIQQIHKIPLMSSRFRSVPFLACCRGPTSRRGLDLDPWCSARSWTQFEAPHLEATTLKTNQPFISNPKQMKHLMNTIYLHVLTVSSDMVIICLQ